VHVQGRGLVTQAHIGVVLDDEELNVVSNSSSRAEFSRVASPEAYNKSYGDVEGKFWRRPNPKTKIAPGTNSKGSLQGATPSAQKNIAQVAIKQTGTSLSKDISLSSGDGQVAYLPLPVDQGAQGATSASGPNSKSPVVFSAWDSMSIATANTYGLA